MKHGINNKSTNILSLVCKGAYGIFLSLIFSLVAMSCTESSKTIVFGDAGWDSMKFHNAVAMYIAKNGFGYEVEEVSGSTAVTYSALKKGDIHVYMETWTDNIASYKDDVQSGSVVELGVNYADNIQGLYVPRYVIEGDASRGITAVAPELRRVENLLDYSDIFKDPENPKKGRIYGSISGWAVDEILRNKVSFYGLDARYTYMDPGSDAALSAAIAGAYERGQPIVAYYWEPTWLTGKYDLVLLEDFPYNADRYIAGECEFPSIPLTVAVHPGFVTEYPEFTEFLKKYSTSSDLTSQALAYINDTDSSYEDAARWFLKKFDEYVTLWLPKDKADAVRETL